ncbi:MAG TPA: protein-glutamate O-methyltransferase CheR [Candidatus Kapabacteria bacterium]|nr:protein-glutamate O-methyltransferase CheR [Candidatus Kapabacteria bacterium]
MAARLFQFGAGKPTEESKEVKKIVPVKMELSDNTFNELRNFIYDQCGIYYTDNKKYLLEGRIAKRISINKLSSFEEYLNFLRSPMGRNELNELFDAITINETYFFRAPQQFEAFETHIVPEILSTRQNLFNPVFRIWSAAASTGEEAYTLAMIVAEKLRPMYPRVQFQILASDINKSVLEQAQQGVYKEYSIRNVPPHLLKKYFKQQGTNYVLSDEIKQMVKFMNINLYDAQQMRTVTNCDVIFCCNVLIYFDMPSKQQVVTHLYNSLNKGGYLFIGYSESLHGISKAFKLVHFPKAMAYQKE